jgi:alkylation response protein AidB-like acyl-CoA dehydrogenase
MTAATDNSTAAKALAAAGDQDSARDVAALDVAARGVERKLAAVRNGLSAVVARRRRSRARVGAAPAAVAGQLPRRCCSARWRSEAFTTARGLGGAAAYVAAESVWLHDAGGGGAAVLAARAVEEALAANGLGPLAVEISGQLTIGAGSLLAYGDDHQQRTFLPLVAEGRPMAFGLTEVGVGVNAKKVQAYVEEHADGYRLFAEGAANKLWITNAVYGGLVGIVARIGKDSPNIGLFIVDLPAQNVEPGTGHDYEFRCEPSGVAAFLANSNSRLHFRNFPVPKANRIPADGVEVLFYCLRMGRCMLAAMAAGYQRMLARDASHYALQRLGVGGPVIRHEVPRLNLGRILGGALQARALAYLSLQQDADGVDLAGLRDLTKSAAAGAGVESMLAAEHVLGGRSFHGGSRVNDARVNLHLFGVVEGEDDLILMGMVRDITHRFVDSYLSALLGVIDANAPDGSKLPARDLLRIGVWDSGARSRSLVARFIAQPKFWRLGGVIVRAVDLRLPLRLLRRRVRRYLCAALRGTRAGVSCLCAGVISAGVLPARAHACADPVAAARQVHRAFGVDARDLPPRERRRPERPARRHAASATPEGQVSRDSCAVRVAVDAADAAGRGGGRRRRRSGAVRAARRHRAAGVRPRVGTARWPRALRSASATR